MGSDYHFQNKGAWTTEYDRVSQLHDVEVNKKPEAVAWDPDLRPTI